MGISLATKGVIDDTERRSPDELTARPFIKMKVYDSNSTKLKVYDSNTIKLKVHEN